MRCFGNGGANMFVLTYSHSCFKVGLPPSVSFRKKQYRVCLLLVKNYDQRCCLPYQKPSGHPAVLSSCELFATSRLFTSSRTTWASPKFERLKFQLKDKRSKYLSDFSRCLTSTRCIGKLNLNSKFHNCKVAEKGLKH